MAFLPGVSRRAVLLAGAAAVVAQPAAAAGGLSLDLAPARARGASRFALDILGPVISRGLGGAGPGGAGPAGVVRLTAISLAGYGGGGGDAGAGGEDTDYLEGELVLAGRGVQKILIAYPASASGPPTLIDIDERRLTALGRIFAAEALKRAGG